MTESRLQTTFQMKGSLLITSQEIVNQSIKHHGILHQSGEIIKCLDWLSTQNLRGFIELGSANGASFYCWAMRIPNGPKVCVDWNYGFGMGPGDIIRPYNSEEEFPTVKRRNNVWRNSFSDVRIVEGDTQLPETIQKTAAVLGDELVDWLFIDAEHTRKAVNLDFNNYKQFVNSGGHVGFHDIHQTKDMEDFWLEMKSHWSTNFEFEGGTGIGIVRLA